MSSLSATNSGALTVASTFSGAGGSCLGFRMVGYRPVVASEFVAAARETYRANCPNVPVLEQDVRDIHGYELLHAAGLQPGELDVLEGSPPCCSWSSCGSREAGWEQERRYSDTKQRTDDLLGEFARLVFQAQPRAFVMENVPGLTHGKAAWHYNDLHRSLWDAGYDVAAWIIDASRFGVAQKRKRLILLGLREDVVDQDRGITAAACRPIPDTHVTTVADALATLPEPDDQEVADREHASIIDKSIYESWQLLGDGHRLGTRNFNMARPFLDEPCPTITDTSGDIGAAGVCHPTEPRKFTPREIAALSSFPSDFKLVGTFRERYERVARSVPPLLMKAVAERLAVVLRKADATP